VWLWRLGLQRYKQAFQENNWWAAWPRRRLRQPMPEQSARGLEGLVVPPQKDRVLSVMAALATMPAPAPFGAIFGRSRRGQHRRQPRRGTMSTKATCLGPCNVAPILQSRPDGIYHGGIDASGTDRIIRDHLLGCGVVEDLAYRPTGAKRALRS
jgi:(2Fe-2S) ferredoxin